MVVGGGPLLVCGWGYCYFYWLATMLAPDLYLKLIVLWHTPGWSKFIYLQLLPVAYLALLREFRAFGILASLGRHSLEECHQGHQWELPVNWPGIRGYLMSEYKKDIHTHRSTCWALFDLNRDFVRCTQQWRRLSTHGLKWCKFGIVPSDSMGCLPHPFAWPNSCLFRPSANTAQVL